MTTPEPTRYCDDTPLWVGPWAVTARVQAVVSPEALCAYSVGGQREAPDWHNMRERLHTEIGAIVGGTPRAERTGDADGDLIEMVRRAVWSPQDGEHDAPAAAGRRPPAIDGWADLPTPEHVAAEMSRQAVGPDTQARRDSLVWTACRALDAIGTLRERGVRR